MIDRNLGFQKLTKENWLTVAGAMQNRVTLRQDGTIAPMVAEDWLEPILMPKILDSVPVEIEALFEAARGTMAYGWFFYPAMTLGAQQLFRVAEAAVRMLCVDNGAPRPRSFKDAVDWLVAKSVIPIADQTRWEALRSLRNLGSHPKLQEHLGPALAFQALTDVADLINGLPFGSTRPVGRS